MAHRADLNSLSAAQRTQLVNLMLNYLTDAVVADHVNIIHSGLEIFTGHRAYILGMENYLTANGGGAFVPLPFWDSASQIPAEFNIVKNQGPTRPPLANLNPNIPKPAQFEDPAVCDYDDPAQLGNDINGWHGSVHCAIGGSMCSLPIASAAPIFWCWHAFVDHIYWDWQRCTVPCPDVTGCYLEIAKKKIRAAGLKVGSTTLVPGCTLPEKCLPSYIIDDASRYAHSPGHGDDGHSHGDASHTHGQEHESDRMPGHGGQKKRPEKLEPSHEFLHPTPDYSYLTRGPRIVAQYPAPFVAAKAGSTVSLTISS
jgi:hypothetical protein